MTIRNIKKKKNELNVTMLRLSYSFIAFAVLTLLFTGIQGKSTLAVKQTKADVCPNPESNSTL